MNTSQEIPATSSRLWRWIGGLGIVYSVLYFLGLLVLTGNQPGIDASAGQLISYYKAHQAQTLAAVFVVAAAMVLFAFFLSALRRELRRNGGDGEQLSTAAAVGGAVYIGGFLVGLILQVALLTAASHHITSAARTLNVLSQDDWVPVVVGLSIVALSTGFAGLRGHVLPRWLAVASIALGLLALAGPLGGIAFLLTPLWTLAIGVVLARRPSPAAVRPAAEVAAPAAA